KEGPPLLSLLVLELVAVSVLEVETVVALELLGIELDAESRPRGHFEAAVLELEGCRDHLACLLREMRVDRVTDHRLGGREVDDRGRRDAELPVAVQAETEVEGLTYLCELQQCGRAPPEVHIAKDDVEGASTHDERDLLEADTTHVGRERNPGVLADETHALDAPGRVFAELDVVLVERTQRSDARFDGP